MERKFGACPLCGRQVQQRNIRAVVRKNQTYGFQLALDGIRATWGALLNNVAVDCELKDEQVQKLIRIGDMYWEMVGKFEQEGMTPDEFAEYLVGKSAECETRLRNVWGK